MEISQLNWAKEYMAYLDFKSKGLRRKAIKSLNNFLLDFSKQSKVERRQFINDLNLLAYKDRNLGKYIPHDLYKLFSEEIEIWKVDEPYNSIAFKWTFNIKDLVTSVSLNPGDQVALNLLCSQIVNVVSMNQHELNAGYGYQGNPKKDLEYIGTLKKYFEKLEDEKWKSDLQIIINDLERSAKEFI